ncbi:MAG TPA: hypothetical protein VKS03_08005 [Thermoanaerobaculia bacterium]|nr:hypothetical protein [Thermoanaerobaculia bacterium]
MTEHEGTQGAPSASGGSSGSGSSGTSRKRTGTRRKTATRSKSPDRRKTGARRSTARRRTAKPVGLERLLNDLAKRANRAGETIASLSEEGATAARKTLGAVTATSKKTINRVKREWEGMDNTRRAQFVGALLGALAAAGAAAASVRKATKR